jgi:hypothetical protein
MVRPSSWGSLVAMIALSDLDFTGATDANRVPAGWIASQTDNESTNGGIPGVTRVTLALRLIPGLTKTGN